MKRVVITGLGTVNPLALNAADTWSALIAGKSGIRAIEHFEASDFSVRFAGMPPGFNPEPVVSRKEARRLDLFIQYAMVAAEEAILSAGLANNFDPDRCGVAVGSGIGGLGTIEQNVRQLVASGPRKVSPFLVPGSVVNMASGNIAIRHTMRGPNFSIATACTVSWRRASSPGWPQAAIQLAERATSERSPTGAAARLVSASPTAMRPDAGASRAARNGRSPQAMASPAWPR